MSDDNSVFSTRVITEIVTLVALATVLSFIKIFELPWGGSVTAGSMVPIIWLALRRGPKVGLFTATLYGFVQLAVQPVIVGPVQGLLDYPLAFGALGFAGFFPKRPLIGATVGIAGRFLMHFISGVVFWGIYAPQGMNTLVYSAIYNGSYLLPELVVSGVVVHLLQRSEALKSYL